jgi:hypothetical protein
MFLRVRFLEAPEIHAWITHIDVFSSREKGSVSSKDRLIECVYIPIDHDQRHWTTVIESLSLLNTYS